MRKMMRFIKSNQTKINEKMSIPVPIKLMMNPSPKTHQISGLAFTTTFTTNAKPNTQTQLPPPRLSYLSYRKWSVRTSSGSSQEATSLPSPSPSPSPSASTLETLLSALASFYPVYVTLGGVVACVKPSTFQWFVQAAPTSYSLSLALIMLSMGITLELNDLLSLFLQRPLAILFGCVAQYTIMPAFAAIISRLLALPPPLSVGLILLGCCPGGTASNVVTLIGRGDVPLSIVMTVCTTLGAVLLTPLLTMLLAGTYVPVDALKLSLSTLQVVVAPILLGSYIQRTFPAAVKVMTPFAPLFAVLASSLLACSVFSENVIRLKSSVAGLPLTSNMSLMNRVQAIWGSELGLIILSVILLHFAGFFVGYLSATLCGFKEKQRRAISIEVGMQNSSLGVVLASSHFASPMVALPPAMSAVIMNIMGSSLGFFWRFIDPSSHSNANPSSHD